MPSANPARRAFEVQLTAAVSAIGMNPSSQIAWQGVPWNPGQAAITEYIRFFWNDLSRNPATMGPGPRVQSDGDAVVQVMVRSGTGRDRADQIMGRQKTSADAGSGLLAGFQYAQPLVYETTSVTIGLAKPQGQPIDNGGWLNLGWYIPWTQWR